MTCAFTGHRYILPEHKGPLAELIAVSIAHAYELGCRKFITGGAIGFDTEVAREIIRFRISHPDIVFSVYVPFIGQEAGWNSSQRDAYDYIISNANEVKYISENYSKDCMKKRNRAMAEDCDMMIAYVYKSHSGSSQTLRMAEEMGKEIRNLCKEIY